MIYQYKGIRPKLGKDVFLAPGVIVLGDVEIGDGSNLWFYTVARGDVNSIRIGRMTNIQDHCMLHVTGEKYPLTIGDDVVVGHRVVLHGCTVGNGALIGIGAIVLDGAVIEDGATVAAGAVVAPGHVIPANTVAKGIPARPAGPRSEEEKAFQETNRHKYHEYGKNFAALVEPVIIER